ncbi:hypothetical protein [Eleftheria terrae]|uniref:hypothetical protein n=1 Tax=Eleftheria terrae TaxID=1597781 RepID=UPI00263B9553|nr:hypothetical protein [Eleftheria terrae]WKB52983.1 hypothetical protein N7L95_00850 [Eleftheria terrae]
MNIKERLMGAPSVLAMRAAADEIARLEHENEQAHREAAALRERVQQLETATPAPALCASPACGADCCGCNRALSLDLVRQYAIRYSYLRDNDPRFGMPTSWLRHETLDEAIDAALKEQP